MSGKAKDRHLFLFGEKLLLTKNDHGKQAKAEKAKYECKNVIEVFLEK